MKCIALLLVVLLALAQPIYAAKAGQELLLFYSNDVHGETKACG